MAALNPLFWIVAAACWGIGALLIRLALVGGLNGWVIAAAFLALVAAGFVAMRD